LKRLALILIALLAAGAFVVLAAGAGGGSGGHTYHAVLDNAFGLVSGGDMKVAGVRAGKITDLTLCTTSEKKCPPGDRGSNRALVTFTVTQNGFGSLRSDVFCQSRPQSLIGEYYLDCQPGTSPQVFKPGSTVPVTRTASTISPDLLGDVLREPYRQRFSIILGELGAAAAGNGQNLNDAIRRAVPALRETDSFLAILAQQNQILADLAKHGDTVLHDLAGNRADVARWVTASRGAAVDSASRKADIERGLQKLPGFLEQLRPAMAALGQVADTNTPALRNLGASAPQLKLLFNNLGPFATASTPSFAALGKASVTGDQAVKAATPTIQQLNQFASGAPELGQNLAIILQHLDDPQFGSTRDPRAVAQHPTTHSNTYTGLESLLQYVFDQASDTNYFNGTGHMLGLGVLNITACDNYADPAAAKANPQCHSWLGPTQPGVTTPDPTHRVGPNGTAARGATRQSGAANTAPAAGTPSGAPQVSTGGGSSGTNPPGTTCLVGVCVPVPTPQVPGTGAVTQAAQGVTNAVGNAQQSTPTGSQKGSGSLLGYLLGP
jgi:ABC-type transporter Mla subunit MlaD